MSQERFYKIVTDSTLSARQKALRLTQEAEACLPYLPIKVETQLAMDEGILCDMFEGNAPYKPRYVLPDYAKFLANGSEYLELDPAVDLDDALHMLTILYHHVPSVTSLPVFFGHLDTILMPYIGNCSEAAVYTKLKRFWIMLDRIFPDAFTHANIGPTDNIVCRTILRIDAELKQIAPNLTFMYDPQVTPDSLMRQATTNICECSKPHIGNYPMHAEAFDQRGFGIVSCYNALPLAGGANTLTRINLKEIAQRSTNIEDFLQQSLPKYCDAMYDLIESRCAFLHEKSHFFDGFLASEGLINEDRFAPMFGIYGMAEAVNILLEKEGSTGKYGHSEQANTLSHTISEHLAIRVESTPVTYGYKGRALLHAQGGLNLDIDVTPGVRIPYGDEPDPVSYVQATAAHHKHYLSGISDILTIDEIGRASCRERVYAPV